jgi:histidinol-phosphatase (PHP family)
MDALFSYHGGHSGEFCRHAEASLQEVIEAACTAGFSHFGISEHMPRERREYLYSNEQDLSPADLSETFAGFAEGEFDRLRERYGKQLQLLKGMETEYLRGAEGEPFEVVVARHRERWGIEYIVGSVHHVREISIDGPVGDYVQAVEACAGVEALEAQYFEDLSDLVTKLRPEVVGHIDLIKKTHGPGWEPTTAVWGAIETCLDAIREAGSLVEINAAGWRKGLGGAYPGPELLKRIVDAGLPLTLGDDSHGPEFVGQDLDRAIRAAKSAGARELHLLEMRDGQAQSRAVAF